MAAKSNATRMKMIRRLEEIESRHREDPLIVIAELSNGEQVKMTMAECLEREDCSFKKVVSGNSFKDLQALLDKNMEEAMKDMEQEENE